MFVYVTLLLDSSLIFLSALFAGVFLTPDIFVSVFYVTLVFSSVLMFLFTGSLFGLYQSYRAITDFDWLAKVTLVWLLLIAFVLVNFWVFDLSEQFSRLWLGLFFAFSWAGSILWRSMAYMLLKYLRARGYNQKTVVIVGAGALGCALVQKTLTDRSSGFRVLALFDDDPNKIGQLLYDLPIQATSELTSWLEHQDTHELWFALPLRAEERLYALLHDLRHTTINLRYVPNLSSLRLLNHAPRQVLGFSMLNLSVSPMSDFSPRMIKWLEDKMLASVMLLLLSPIMLILAIGVKVSSKGPVFYRQERIGLSGKPFMMLKFRSMAVDAEKNGIEWGNASHKKSAGWFGRLIRRTSLDELPQLLNVLLGDMSLVGPRPERTEFVAQFRDEIPGYMQKHLVKAGITGWAQVHGLRGDTCLTTRIQYDLWYIEHWSLALDIKILLLTLVRFMSKNAR